MKLSLALSAEMAAIETNLCLPLQCLLSSLAMGIMSSLDLSLQIELYLEATLAMTKLLYG